ncbi:MAG: hypothetical protein OXI22_02415 [Defluviicoccus sp.]|nr:hypothetical protein [Defluviicoccus sp.]MDE0382716.1 hypothetical protein [Defluviicoccus sp.]
MHHWIAGPLTVAAICAASVAVAHPVYYAMATAETKAASLSLPAKAHTALADDVDAARAEALAQCRKATNRDCVVIGAGAVAHDH